MDYCEACGSRTAKEIERTQAHRKFHCTACQATFFVDAADDDHVSDVVPTEDPAPRTAHVVTQVTAQHNRTGVVAINGEPDWPATRASQLPARGGLFDVD